MLQLHIHSPLLEVKRDHRSAIRNAVQKYALPSLERPKENFDLLVRLERPCPPHLNSIPRFAHSL